MRQLFANGLFWSSVACCLLAQFFIVRSVRGARHLAEPTAGMPPRRSRLELVWAVVPALGLIVLLAFTWRAIQRTASPDAPQHGAPHTTA